MVPQASRKRLDDGWVEDGRRTFWRCWELCSNFWYLHEYSPWNFNQSYFTYISITIAGFDWKHVIFCPNFDANLCFSLMSGIRGIPHALVSTQLTLSWESQRNISLGGPIKNLREDIFRGTCFYPTKIRLSTEGFSFPTWSSMGMAYIKRPTSQKKAKQASKPPDKMAISTYQPYRKT